MGVHGYSMSIRKKFVGIRSIVHCTRKLGGYSWFGEGIRVFFRFLKKFEYFFEYLRILWETLEYFGILWSTLRNTYEKNEKYQRVFTSRLTLNTFRIILIRPFESHGIPWMPWTCGLIVVQGDSNPKRTLGSEGHRYCNPRTDTKQTRSWYIHKGVTGIWRG